MHNFLFIPRPTKTCVLSSSALDPELNGGDAECSASDWEYYRLLRYHSKFETVYGVGKLAWTFSKALNKFIKPWADIEVLCKCHKTMPMLSQRWCRQKTSYTMLHGVTRVLWDLISQPDIVHDRPCLSCWQRIPWLSAAAARTKRNNVINWNRVSNCK